MRPQTELVLYDPSLIVTRGSGSKSLQVGAGQDPLTYHSVETIDATTSGGEQFILGAGFGKETIQGFAASGASPDTTELATSSFSFLHSRYVAGSGFTGRAGPTPAAGSTGLTISNSHGDSLTLAGVGATTIAANPAAVHFA